MRESRQEAEFLFESVERVRRHSLQRLQRQHDFPAAVIGAVDDAHPAATQFTKDVKFAGARQVRSDFLAPLSRSQHRLFQGTERSCGGTRNWGRS